MVQYTLFRPLNRKYSFASFMSSLRLWSHSHLHFDFPYIACQLSQHKGNPEQVFNVKSDHVSKHWAIKTKSTYPSTIIINCLCKLVQYVCKNDTSSQITVNCGKNIFIFPYPCPSFIHLGKKLSNQYWHSSQFYCFRHVLQSRSFRNHHSLLFLKWDVSKIIYRSLWSTRKSVSHPQLKKHCVDLILPFLTI